MAWLLAVVAQSLGGRANFRIVADIAALVACTTRKGRHPEDVYWISSSVPVEHHVRPRSSLFLRKNSCVQCLDDHFLDRSVATIAEGRLIGKVGTIAEGRSSVPAQLELDIISQMPSTSELVLATDLLFCGKVQKGWSRGWKEGQAKG